MSLPGGRLCYQIRFLIDYRLFAWNHLHGLINLYIRRFLILYENSPSRILFSTLIGKCGNNCFHSVIFLGVGGGGLSKFFLFKRQFTKSVVIFHDFLIFHYFLHHPCFDSCWHRLMCIRFNSY